MAAARSCECPAQSASEENRNVYIKGPLLEAVQRSNMFPDCKTFVDMKLRYPPARILADFELFSNCRRNDGSLYFLQMFVEKHFEEKGSELENCMPIDWNSEPPFAKKIYDSELRQFGLKLNELWKQLCCRLKHDVQKNPQLYSSIYVPNPFIIPGGRFLEYYYWDSYWIVIGLLSCGMHKTAKGIIDNFLFLVSRYGSIPNGGRIYYIGRSQPPLLIHMMKAYVIYTNDEKYAIDSLPLLETEFQNFLENHRVECKGYTMYHYRDTATGPRPESFREDLAATDCISAGSDKDEFYADIRAACESGMDFSSRWFINKDGTNEGNLRDTKTRSIVPVDLNAILFRNSKILSEFNKKAGNTQKAEDYQDVACDLAKAIRDVLWNEETGIWLDYDLANDKPRPYFCVSNFYPLWMRSFPIVDKEKISQSVMAYIECNKLDSYAGGVPNTLVNTNLQWDYPNVWPCMMFVLIEGLDNLGTPEAKELSKRWGHRWVKCNYELYKSSGYMYEKYNCENFGTYSNSCEYENQTGFGWTNGVAIYYLSKYGKDICLADTSDGSGKVKQRKDYVITSEIQMPLKKRELIITSEDNMNKAAQDLCYCGNHGVAPLPCEEPKDEFLYHTPKSGDKYLDQCQSENSQNPSAVENPQTNYANYDCSNPQSQVQFCEFCGRILDEVSVVEEPVPQEESGFCQCQPDEFAPKETVQEDESIFSCPPVSQSNLPSLGDKSTCICPDEEELKRKSELECPMDCETAELPKEEKEDPEQCSCNDHPSPTIDIKSKIFPLSDANTSRVCSEDKVVVAKSKDKCSEKESS